MLPRRVNQGFSYIYIKHQILYSTNGTLAGTVLFFRATEHSCNSFLRLALGKRKRQCSADGMGDGRESNNSSNPKQK